MARLEFRNVSKSFGKTSVIQNLSFIAEDGELFVLLGPSGCGKSTILRLIAGLESSDMGDILINDKPVKGLAPKDRNVAMVFQNYALYPHMTVFDNMAFPLKVKRLPKESIDHIVREKAKLLGLSELFERKPKTLSGGQRQRVALGRALVRNPQVFLFDEPLSNLDAKLRVSTRAEIAGLQAKLKATMIYVTHDQEEALSLGDRIGILYDGRLQQIGTPREIYDQPENLFCAGFVGNPRINLLRAIVSDKHEVVFSEKIRPNIKDISNAMKSIPVGTELEIGIRPENIFFERQHDNDFRVRCEILHNQFAGDGNIVFGRIMEQEISIRSRRIPDTAKDSQADIYINLRDCLFFDALTGKRLV